LELLEGSGVHGDPVPTGGMIPRGAPHLKAAAPGFKEGVQIGIGGNVEFARQVERGLHTLVFGLVRHELFSFWVLSAARTGIRILAVELFLSAGPARLSAEADAALIVGKVEFVIGEHGCQFLDHGNRRAPGGVEFQEGFLRRHI